MIFDYGFTLSSALYFQLAPPSCPDWPDLIQTLIFRDAAVMDAWFRGVLRLKDLADRMADATRLPSSEVLNYLRLGCAQLALNHAPLALAQQVRASSLRSALVTLNGDIFSDMVVRSQGLDTLFDVIVNSADVGQCNKAQLWPLVFRALGDDIGYHNTLLIEDNATQIALFRDLGGVAYQYQGDAALHAWLSGTEATQLLGKVAGQTISATP